MFPDASLYKTITAQTTNKASIDFMSFLLENVGITTIAEVETAFKINGEDENAPDFETDIVKIYTSASDSFTQTYDDSGEILFDEQNIRMIKKELSINEYITGWDFYIDNTSEHRIQIVATQNTVNGKNIESTLTFQPIECGKKAYESVSFFNSDLNKTGISNVENIGSHFTIADPDTNEILFEKDILFNGDSSGVITAPPIKEGVVFSDEYIQVSISNLNIDNYSDSTMDVKIENKYIDELYYSAGKLRINGKEVSGSTGPKFSRDFLEKISPYSEYNTCLRIHRNSLKESKITEIRTLEMDMSFIVGHQRTHDVTINIPFDTTKISTISISPEIATDASDYIVDTFFIHGQNSNSVLYELTNPNDVDTSLTATLEFKDSDENVLDTQSDSVKYISPGKYNFMLFRSTYKPDKVTITIIPSEFKKEKAQLSYNVDETNDGTLKISVTNIGNKVSHETVLMVVFTENGEVTGYSRGLNGHKSTTLHPGETGEIEITNMSFDKYYIYLNGYYE